MELQEKEKKKDRKGYKKAIQKESKEKRCLLTPDVKSFWSKIKGKHPAGKEFQISAVWGKKPVKRVKKWN